MHVNYEYNGRYDTWLHDYKGHQNPCHWPMSSEYFIFSVQGEGLALLGDRTYDTEDARMILLDDITIVTSVSPEPLWTKTSAS